MELKDIKLEYYQKELKETDLAATPIAQLKEWMEQAYTDKIDYHHAAVLSTVSKDLTPSSRVILIKEINEDEGLTFFTNYNSHKCQDLFKNPKVSVNFFWKEADRQIRLTCVAKKSTRQKSQDYFNTRPLESRISAICSDQSSQTTKEKMQQEIEEFKKENKEVRCPEYWGGVDLKITKAEFWQGRPNRLHDRFVYELEDKGEKWSVSRLAP